MVTIMMTMLVVMAAAASVVVKMMVMMILMYLCRGAEPLSTDGQCHHTGRGHHVYVPAVQDTS